MPSDVRRSARGAPPITKPPAPDHTSSSSSLSSARQDRSVRGTVTQKSATPHSLSSEDPNDQPRRSQRSHPAKEEDVKANDEPEEDAGEEEEITRCICGQQEYPGPPLSEAFNAADAQSEDAGGLFISCDGCSVWQHGGCVGIIEEAQVPDKYYCEECKPKQHELHTDSRGQFYSLYQPVYSKLHRKGSISKHGDKAQRERETTASRASTDPMTGKRRATMRSKEHDDEEEAMRKAIEESKREVGDGKRNGKRSREDAEDKKQSIKRQRTGSQSVPLNVRKVSSEDESEGEPGMPNASKSKKARAEAAQTARQAEVREKEIEREQARNEAAGRREQRAGRRRVEDDLADDTPNPTSTRASPPPSSQPASPPAHVGPEKVSHKKGAGKKVKKLGNNQYTKLREQGLIPSSPHSKKRQLAKDQHGTVSSGDEQLPNGETHTSNSTSKNSPDHPNGNGNGTGKVFGGKFGKGRKHGLNGVNGAHKAGIAGFENGERTLGSMSRSIDAMARSITAAQLEMAGSWTPPAKGERGGAVQAPTSEPVGQMDGAGDGGGGGGGDSAVNGGGAVLGTGTLLGADGKAPEGVSAMEMADLVSRGIHEWQRRFGHLA